MAGKRNSPKIVSSYSPRSHRPRKLTRPNPNDLRPSRKMTWKVDGEALYIFRKNSHYREKHGSSIVLIINKINDDFFFVLVNECYETVPASHLHPLCEEAD